ncbi:radical SAM family heme chaperone HemW [Clostridium sp. DJ247]|uniref:radical SAM family heme chaperone HemW n=1 Tax=Clostridium sp. DJ247 TaxID=2726188 RepID=UPI0016284EEB|nr:radical SAM family heme chaperone HemW [Clostridium sp. DJ247]MBC2579255.1 oxygen-independent coproporphyrinogen III oxidase [Clostridium sp. DJ247]MBC2579294.1 oxygen-independent coproporphyrinogen III oxidase [Clostridium sp. DJ247]
MDKKYGVTKKSEETALYIHIPFCKQKCLYCDFPSFCGKERLMIDYSKALAKDIESIGHRKVNTIFVGGGTPTYLSLEAWENIGQSIDNLYKSNELEFTVEGNPGTFSAEKLMYLKKLGVNRLSIGLQAWDNSTLKDIGRIHTVEEFIHGYKLARELGFNNINIDLMFGLPNQSLDSWKRTLENVAALSPEHISCYSLIIEEGTPFEKMYHNGSLSLPSEEVEREMYRYAVNFLRLNGYNQYEISNFAMPEKECKHNLVYWNLGNYIGCGAASHSYIDGYRYRKTENIEEYIKVINSYKDIKLDKHKNSIKDDMEEFMFMGLRKINGISIEEFQNRFNKDIFEVYESVIKTYLDNGMIVRKNNRLYLSARGIEVSNSIMCDFILS